MRLIIYFNLLYLILHFYFDKQQPELVFYRPNNNGATEVLVDTAAAGCAPDNDFVIPDSLRDDTVLIAIKSSYRMHLYYPGKHVKTYRIALGQNPIGHKQLQGDNKTPEGNYRIIQKTVGPFTGNYAAYLGTRWMRLNYPNNNDAQHGLTRGVINLSQYKSIISANSIGTEPPETIRLGGGIGIHGWNGAWPGPDKQNLTWGCISLQNADNEDLFNSVLIGCRVIILP